jgi:hypothetical protein
MGGRREGCGGVGAQSVRRRRHAAAAAAVGCNLAVTGGDVLTSMVVAEVGGYGAGRWPGAGSQTCSGQQRCLLTV